MRISDWSSDVCSSDLGQYAKPPRKLGLCAKHNEHRRSGQADARLYAPDDGVPPVQSLSADDRDDRTWRRIAGKILLQISARCLDHRSRDRSRGHCRWRPRSEERLVGKECVSQCKYRGWPETKKNK